MALSSDLMGLGLPPALAAEVAIGGIGPLTIVGAGSSFATGTKVQTSQFVFSSTSTSGTAISLPTVGGDTGALLCDLFFIANLGTSSLLVFTSTNVALQANGSNNSNGVKLQTFQSLLTFPVSTTQWISMVV